MYVESENVTVHCSSVLFGKVTENGTKKPSFSFAVGNKEGKNS